MTKVEIIKVICESKDYRFTHDELMRMTKKELLGYYPQYSGHQPQRVYEQLFRD